MRGARGPVSRMQCSATKCSGAPGDPEPPRTWFVAVPGLQRITTQSSVRRLRKLICAVLRCARDMRTKPAHDHAPPIRGMARGGLAFELDLTHHLARFKEITSPSNFSASGGGSCRSANRIACGRTRTGHDHSAWRRQDRRTHSVLRQAWSGRRGPRCPAQGFRRARLDRASGR
jgi:hypothetical protein